MGSPESMSVSEAEVTAERTKNEQLAELVSLMNGEEESPMDVMQSEALAYNEARTKLLEGLQQDGVDVAVKFETAFMEDSPFSEFISDDKELLTVAARSLPRRVMEIASERLRGDKEFVRNALEHGKDVQCGIILEHASAALKDDPEIVEVAMRRYPRALAAASERIKNDASFVLMAARRFPYILKLGATWGMSNGAPYVGAELRAKIAALNERAHPKKTK